MLPKGRDRVISRCIENPSDFLQGDTELPEEEDLLETIDFGTSIDTVSGRSRTRRAQESERIVVPQRPRTDTG
jgi:hypothetical protein